MRPTYPGADFVGGREGGGGGAFKFRKRKGNLSSCVYVLHKTLSLVIFHVVVLQRTTKNVPKCNTILNARTGPMFC